MKLIVVKLFIVCSSDKLIISERFDTSLYYLNVHLQKIVEKFRRNKAKPANEDIAECIYLISEDRIQLTFHHQDDKITASTRDFIKPPNANDKGAVLTFSQDMTSTFRVDPLAEPPKNLFIYNLLIELVDKEDKTVHSVRDSEEEVSCPILAALTQNY